METKYNLRNFIDNLLLPNKFYSTVFEIQIAKLYSSVYNLEILEEQPNIKTPDFKINIANGKTIYIECKSLQDFELVHNEEYSRLIDSLQKYCNKQHKSNQIIIRTGTNFNKQYTNDILTEVENLINQDKFGDFKLENLNIEISISKISNWDTPIYGNIQIIHPEQSQLSIITQVKKLPNGMMENKNIIMIGVESKPILNFKKRIEDEIKRAKEQIPDEQLGIIHMQLPIHKGLNFEEYINKNYDELKRILKTKTTRINALIISNPIYNMKDFNPLIPNNQYYVIPNMNVTQNINFNFRYPFTNFIEKNIPDLPVINPNPKIEFGNIIYTPSLNWNIIPLGAILLNLINPSGKIQFKIWKSYDKAITFDIIINGERFCVKSDEDPFIVKERNRIDLFIQDKEVFIYVNKKRINIRKFI